MIGAPLSGNPVKRKLAAGELVLCMALRQARTADAAQIVWRAASMPSMSTRSTAR